MNANASSPQIKPHHDDGSIKETLESIIIAFVLAFVFRAFVVEAFVIPTGSMAPTLLGKHLRVECPQCGYNHTVGIHQAGDLFENLGAVNCPMCFFPIEQRKVPAYSGDRILVLKYLYSFTEPQRWDVVVFKNPQEPGVNYIKRLVGLPGEKLWLVAGNVYTLPLGAPADRPWRIERKTDRAQSAVWQPVYHSQRVPIDAAIGRRQTWHSPFKPIGQWDGNSDFRSFRFTGDGGLTFEHNDITEHNYYAYNTMDRTGGRSTYYQDLRLGATMTPEGPGLAVKFQTSAMGMKMEGSIDASGQATLRTSPLADQGMETWTQRGAGSVSAGLAAGKPRRVEIWHVDQRLSLRVDGSEAASWEYTLEDLGIMGGPGELPKRKELDHQPDLKILTSGAPVKMTNVSLDRDLYYTNMSGVVRGTDEPVEITLDRFFCLGDNSPASQDSRLWNSTDPWVHHQTAKTPTENLDGFVPRPLMIGKAFFVYFPAPFKIHPDHPIGVIPNFGQMRFIH